MTERGKRVTCKCCEEQRQKERERARRQGENNTTEQSLPQHHLLTDQACSTKSGLDQRRRSVDLKSGYLLHSFDVVMSFDWARAYFQFSSCVPAPAAFKTVSHIKHCSQHVVIIAAILILSYGASHTFGSVQHTSKRMMEATGSLYGSCIHTRQLASPCMRNALAHRRTVRGTGWSCMCDTETLNDEDNDTIKLTISILPSIVAGPLPVERSPISF